MDEFDRKKAIVRASKEAIETYLFNRTVGIVAHDGGARPLEHGTGILLRLEEEPIILTAGHVIANYSLEHLQILATRQMSNVRVRPGNKTFVGAGMMREVDVGFLRLTEETLEGLQEREFFSLMDFEVFPTELETDLPVVFGLPESEHFERTEIVHRFGTLCYLANNLEDVDWNATEERPKSLFVEYPNQVEDLFSGRLQNLPHPRGMSGGGTWRVAYHQGSNLWTPNSLRLVAMNAEFVDLGHEMDFIRAVRVEPILEFLSEHFPSAGRYLAAARDASGIRPQEEEGISSME